MAVELVASTPSDISTKQPKFIIKKPKPNQPMKKIIYIMVIALVSSMTITSCTEDEVKPSKPNNGGGAGSLDPL
jgi:predicted nucleic acid binding AN1-type Zn finger protein